MTTDNICFYLQNLFIQTSQTGSQKYSDTSPFSIPCSKDLNNLNSLPCLHVGNPQKQVYLPLEFLALKRQPCPQSKKLRDDETAIMIRFVCIFSSVANVIKLFTVTSNAFLLKKSIWRDILYLR